MGCLVHWDRSYDRHTNAIGMFASFWRLSERWRGCSGPITGRVPGWGLGWSRVLTLPGMDSDRGRVWLSIREGISRQITTVVTAGEPAEVEVKVQRKESPQRTQGCDPKGDAPGIVWSSWEQAQEQADDANQHQAQRPLHLSSKHGINVNR